MLLRARVSPPSQMATKTWPHSVSHTARLRAELHKGRREGFDIAALRSGVRRGLRQVAKWSAIVLLGSSFGGLLGTLRASACKQMLSCCL